ncbi:MAG TPA: hypothetical protein VMJ70_10550 [Candidatus Sulfotelmatobacter sp.]|nr:hypothetical protein [Candidatus Sulfotelmatobacter sp.]
MKPRYAMVFVLFALLVLIAALEITALAGAWSLHHAGRFDDEIAWLEGWEPVRFWEPGRHAVIDQRYLDRVHAELLAGRLDRAAVDARLARARFRSRGRASDPQLLALGVEVCTRAADRLERNGSLSAAADWNDSLFVLAVRAGEPRMRNAAVAAFTEGLDLRVRDGKPCDALSRVLWAEHGLGGEIPGFSPQTRAELESRCARSRSVASTR